MRPALCAPPSLPSSSHPTRRFSTPPCTRRSIPAPGHRAGVHRANRPARLGGTPLVWSLGAPSGSLSSLSRVLPSGSCGPLLRFEGREPDPHSLFGFLAVRQTCLDGQLLLHRRQKVACPPRDKI